MIRKVKVKEIRPNPFQARKSMDRDATKSLAEEIEKVGLWPGALRGREKNSHVELCFGHRRLEAVKLLGWKEVEVDVVKLSDEDMSLQALIENLQREGLNDADRGDGIAAYIKLRLPSFKSSSADEDAEDGVPFALMKEIGGILGLSLGRTSELLRLSRLGEDIKAPVRQQKIAGKTALAAARIGGAAAVKEVAKKEMGYRAMEAIGTKFAALPEDTEQERKVKEKVRERFTKGEISTPEDVVTKARQIKGQTTRKAAVPPDLIDVMREWTERAHRWAKDLEKVAPYIEYIDTQPEVAKRWRSAAKELIEKLEKFS
jgi:ParB family transcriptional regulator, chromosome partitioning protein